MSQFSKNSYLLPLPPPPLDNTPLTLYKALPTPKKIMENSMAKDTERKMIDEVAGIIKETVFGADHDDKPSSELCRRAAVLVINHLADSYDEMENSEPSSGD